MIKWSYAVNKGRGQKNKQALAEAIAFSSTNRDEAYAELGKYFKVPPPVLKATPWPNLVVDLNDAQMRFWTDTMRNQDMLKKPPMVSSLIVK